MSPVKLIECPRDAMQGWQTLIPTAQKVAYLNQLLKVGFDTLDCVSFVSAKAIPQMADSADVLAGLDLSGTQTKLLAIVANVRGAETASTFDQLSYIGFPFSISPAFQMRNTNSTIAESWDRVQAIQALCLKHKKELVIYISMGFGNPYGDHYDETVIAEWVEKMQQIGVKIISLADTVGIADPDSIYRITAATIKAFPLVEVGVHLHSTPHTWREKLQAAHRAGCIRFDGALKGIGGCPMAGDDLTGNMDSLLMAGYFAENNLPLALDENELHLAATMAETIFI